MQTSQQFGDKNKDIDEEKIFPFDFSYTIKKLDILLNSLIYNSTNDEIKENNKWIIRLPPYCSRLQSGYNCGIVGIRMAIEFIDKSFLGKEFIDELFMTAVLKGYSKEGEMFSSYHLSEITNLLFNNLNFNYIKSNVISFPTTSDILNHLSNGFPILVPYDADKNWRPCCTGGTRAHWAMIIGFIIPNNSNTINDNTCNNKDKNNTLKYKIKKIKVNNNNDINDKFKAITGYEEEKNENFYENYCKKINQDNINQYREKYMFLTNRYSGGDDGDNSEDIQTKDKFKLHFFEKPTTSFNRLPFIDDDYDDYSDNDDNYETIVDENERKKQKEFFETKLLNHDQVFLICQHGKSQIVQLWEYNLLRDSNSCLSEFPKERRNDERWIIPNDLNDLKNKWIFLKR
ncbi:hypothetical protein RB653_004044 [Dictyostelium firmibasis]|uniref:Actin maturation protease n=1 Tax=Dictyostelium firmibasis TaxID=79012 RepID=A0AAN7TYT2_9MYCE